MRLLFFRQILSINAGQDKARWGFYRLFALKQPCYVADTGVMRPPHKNENLLFKDFQDFLVRSQQLPPKRIPFYLRWVNRFHEFCSRQHLDGMGKEATAPYLEDLARDHEDWQGQQAKEAVRLYRYFKALPEPNGREQTQSNGQAAWQPVEDEIVKALRLRHRSYRTEQSYVQC